MKNKIASLLVMVLIITSIVPVYAAPSKNQSQNDIAGHWAEADIVAMASNGVMGGYPDGSMKPNRYVTIAETVKIINKAFNIVGAGDVYSIPYADVKIHEWYSADIALAVENGYLLSIAPGKRLKPNAPATREQIGAMFAQVMGLESKTLDSISKFIDYSSITQGYNYYFAAAVKEGLFAGYPDNTLKPQATVTRGIMAAVTNRAMSKAQTVELHKIFLGPNDILIENDGEMISNKIFDNVWISASVGEGTVTLDNVKVRGKLVIKGGGSNSVIIKGESEVPLVYLEKETRDLRLKVEKPAIVGTVNVNAGSRNYITGEIESLIPNIRRGEVKVEKAKIKSIEVKGEDSSIYIDKDSEVTNLTVNRSATNTYMSLDGKITSLLISGSLAKAQVYGKVNSIHLTSTARSSEIIAEKSANITTVKTEADRLSIRGTGKVDSAIINGNDCKIDTIPTKVEIDKNASGTTSNGKPITGGTTGVTKPGGGVDGGGTVGPNDPDAKVTSMEITKYPSIDRMVYTVGDILNLDGLEITFKYSNGATASVPVKDFEANLILMDPNPNGSTKVLASTKSVKITHVPTNKTTTLNITVNPIPKVKELIITKSSKTNYIDSELLDLTGMEVLLRYDNEVTTTSVFKLTTLDGKASNSFKDLGLETSLQNGTPLTLKRPGTVQETKTVVISFRNPGNQIVKTQEPLYININPIPRITNISASGYKFSYVYGNKFDFSDLEVKLMSSDDNSKQTELRYIPTLNGFVFKDKDKKDSEYTVEDLYKQVASNGDVLREIRITQDIAKKDVTVEHGSDVGLGDKDNVKKLKITHFEKDVSPASVDINIEIKPPSKAVSATITGMGIQLNESHNAEIENWDITVFRDSIIQQNQENPQASDSIKVIYGKLDGELSSRLYEYTNKTDQSTWKPYNYSQGDTFRNMQIIVMQKTVSGTIIQGPDLVTSKDYKWQRRDVAVKIIHSESGVKLDANGNPIPTSYNNIELAYIPINVRPEKGIELFEMQQDPTLEGVPPKEKMFFVDDKLDISLLSILFKEYGSASAETIVFGETGDIFTSKGIRVTLLLKDGRTEIGTTNSELNGITLNSDHDGAKVKISILDGDQSRIIYSKELKVKTKIKNVNIYTIAPKVGEKPSTTIAPTPDWYPEYGSDSISWIGELDTSGRFKAGVSYQALIRLRTRLGYTFEGINSNNVTVDNIDGGKISPEPGSFILSENRETITFRVRFTSIGTLSSTPTMLYAAPEPVMETFSYTEPPKAKIVSTADAFYDALSNNNVPAITVNKDITLSNGALINKPVTVDGATISYVSDPPVASKRSSGALEKHSKTAKQFKITGKGVLYIKSGAVLNKVGKGDFKVENSGKLILEGTISRAGKKWIGKEGNTIKTYGKSAIVITGSMSGQVMTIEGNADLLQSLTLDQNLVISSMSTFNIKNSATLTANNNITINNKGDINVDENATILGTGKYIGESPMGYYFTGFIMDSDEPIRYSSKKTVLNQTQSGSNIRLSFRIPKEAGRVYLSDTFINATDLRPGSYELKGNDTIGSVVLEVAKPSSNTGLSRVSFGYKSRGIVIPSNISLGKYTLSGIIGGSNVTLDIYVD